MQDIDWDLYANFLAPIDGENISEQCRNDSQKYIDILNSVSKKTLDFLYDIIIQIIYIYKDNFCNTYQK